MRSEGNTGAYVAGRDVTVPTAPVIYVRGSELDDRHFHDLDLLGKCRTEKCDYGHAEPALSADLECVRCGEIKPISAQTRLCDPCSVKTLSEPLGELHPAEEVVELPDYILAIAVVMRDTEGHPDRAVRAARKVVVTALQGLDRVLKASASPSRVDAAPPDHVTPRNVPMSAPIADHLVREMTARGTPRKRRANLTDAEKVELRRRYEAGESTTQLGKAFGMSSTGVGNALRRLGTAMRDRGGRGGSS